MLSSTLWDSKRGALETQDVGWYEGIMEDLVY